ncbi:MAG: protein translocase subunit SecF [Acidobacteriota bacterium]|nr:protein translocase subunit SecF [Acidobacteriota bacterium]
MELFKETKIDFLSKKWLFASVSIILFLIGLGAYFGRGFNYGIDFTGGTIILVKFQDAPDYGKLRDVLESETSSAPTLQSYGPANSNSVQVRLQKALGTGSEYEADKDKLVASLRKEFDPGHVQSAQRDFNNVGESALKTFLLAGDPDGLKAQDKTIQETEDHYAALVTKVLDYRNKTADGLMLSLDDLKSAGASDAVVAALKKEFYTGPFAIKGLESIGAIVGSDLRRRAGLAIGLSLLAMLVYIAFRFKPIYGVAAIIALFHDVAITLGFFALTQKEISLTVIAALLTLVGYSVNDTIVIFDRVRENLRVMRKDSLYDILNKSINQTLSRTILTSGFTFLAAAALFLFGGEVLNGFSFALVVGIILGSYSTIALSSTIVEWWYRKQGAK